MKITRHMLLLAAIILLAFVLRICAIDKYPIGFTQDEAALGYDAYSLLKTGRDQWGEFLPLTLRSLGDFKLPVYSYLAIPSVMLFGLNEFAVRLPSAVFGSLAVLITYLFVKQLGRRKQGTALDYVKLATISAVLLAISPWHIGLSRGAFEANLTTFFVPLGLWLYLRAENDGRLYVLSGIAFGLNMFSYHAARFFTPLLILALAVYELRDGMRGVGKYLRNRISYIATISIFFVLILVSVEQGGATRNADLSIVNMEDGWQYITERRIEGILHGESNFISKLFASKYSYIIDQFTDKYFSFLSPTFLFTTGAGSWNYGVIPGRGVLYSIEVVFIIFALYSLVKKKDLRYSSLLIVWLLISPIPAALAKGPQYSANRVAVMMPAIQILSVYGIVALVGSFRNKNIRQYVGVAISAAFVISFIYYLNDYYFHTRFSAAKPMNYGMSEAVNYAESVKGDYDKIFFSRSLSAPNIFVQFYAKTDPILVQKYAHSWLEYERAGYLYLDLYDGYRLDDYIFGSVDKGEYESSQRMLIAGRPDEFLASYPVKKVIMYPNGEPAIVIISND